LQICNHDGNSLSNYGILKEMIGLFPASVLVRLWAFSQMLFNFKWDIFQTNMFISSLVTVAYFQNHRRVKRHLNKKNLYFPCSELIQGVCGLLSMRHHIFLFRLLFTQFYEICTCFIFKQCVTTFKFLYILIVYSNFLNVAKFREVS